MRTFKVVIAGQNYRVVGGSDRVLFKHIELLEAQGHRPIPFCAQDRGNIQTPWDQYFPKRTASLSSASPINALKYIYSFDSKQSLRRLLQTEKNVDIVHCHIYYGKLTASIISAVKEKGLPLVQTLHEYKAVCPVYTLMSNGVSCEKCNGFNFYKAATNRCNRNSILRSSLSSVEAYFSLILGSVSKFDKFIAVSNHQRDTVIRMGIPSNKVVTIYNSISPISIKNHTTEDYFLFHGRIESIKGIWVLLEAFRLLPNLKLVVVGKGSELENAKYFCTEKKIYNVKFLDFVTGQDLQQLISKSIAGIVPSIWPETFGLAAAEVLNSGRPVIGSNIGGIPEVLDAGNDSILVEPGSVSDLVQAIKFIANNPIVADKMGKLGSQNIARKFSEKVHYNKLISLYSDF